MQTAGENPEIAAGRTVDAMELERAVKEMYRRVAREPHTEFHFEMGRAMAERLGYDPAVLDRIPQPSIESFAGVGHHFGLAALSAGESVLDLGSGSGMDCFVAARMVGPTGTVVGVDMTEAQRAKATRLRDEARDLANVRFVDSHIEAVPFADASFDCVISNGVINLVADKERVFREAARVVRRGGRIALSDIVTDVHLPASVVCDATLWASCIGGAMHRESYQEAIQQAGFEITCIQPNPAYHFLAGQAQRAAKKFEVHSISLVAVRR